MSSIKNIITLLDSELHQLIAPYHTQIKELKMENERLYFTISSLTSENNKLQEQQSYFSQNSFNTERNGTLLDHIRQFSPFVTDEMIDELCISSSKEDAFLLLFHCNNFLSEGHMEKVVYILDLLVHNPKPLLHDNQDIRGLIHDIFHKLITSGTKDNAFMELIIVRLLKIISELQSTNLNKYMTNYLQENYSELLDFTLYFNEPSIIIQLLRLIMQYELETELIEILSHIINVEWGFLDYNLSKNEFCFFLWYTYLFDLDQQLIDNTEECTKWLDEKQSNLQFYTYMYDCINEQKIENKKDLDNLLHGFRQGQTFNDTETNRILEKVQEALKPFMTKDSKRTIYYHGDLYMVQTTQLAQLITFYQLQQKKIMIPLYKGKNKNILSKFTLSNIYVTENEKRAFITSDMVDTLQLRNYPEVLKLLNYDKGITTDQTEKSMMEQNMNSFQWPSTEIQEKPQPTAQEHPTLNENSELKRLGYQITGLTREKRWNILQKAVPSIGLKKVAYIIANNVRLRKGQKNGREKYRYAIAEWEYDLYKLKKRYYKKDFTWPNF